MKKCFAFAILFFWMACGLYAQRTITSLSGTVTDPSGAVVPEAKVTATNISTAEAATAQTHADGFYVLPSLSPGTYRLQVEKAGFERYVEDGIVLAVDQPTSVNVKLSLGSAVQTVSVTSQGEQVNLRSGAQSYEITSQMAEELPLNGRNVLQLMTLAPDTGPGNSTYFAQGATRPDSEVFVSAGGGQGNTSVFYLDGGLDVDPYTNVANIVPNPDAIEEFSFQTNSFNAKYAGSGGGVMNAVTKGGTNKFHGSLFEFVRNGPLFDARNFFANSPTATTDLLKWNQFGGSVGGPIQKNKTFFFFSYQGLREHVGAAVTFDPMANAAEINNGDWSSVSKQLVNPFTGAAFVGNQVPTSLYNTASMKVIALLPVASATTGLAEFTKPSIENDNQFVTRVDHNFGSKFTLRGTYMEDKLAEPSTEVPTDILTELPNEYWRSQHATVSGTYTMRPTLLANFAVTYDRVAILYTGAPGFPDWPQLGVNLTPLATGGTKTSMQFAITNYFSVGWDALYRLPRQSSDYATNWTWIKGNHTLEFGGEFTRNASTLDQDFLSNGYFAFGGTFSGNNMLDFMLGDPSLFEQYSPIYASYRRSQPAVYINDTWKMTRHLTWALGVRYNPWVPLADITYHQMEVFNPIAYAAGTHSVVYPNLPPGYLVPGDPGVVTGGIPSSYRVFDPRLGVAWDVFGDGKTSIRAGFGIYHDQVMGVDYNDEADFPPYVVGETRQPPPSLLNPYQGITNPFPVQVPTPRSYSFANIEPFSSSPYYFNDSYPTTNQWNLTAEHQLPSQTLVRIVYEGTSSYHMPGGIEDNAGVYNPALSYTQNVATITSRRPMGQYFTTLPVQKTIGVSNFNALIASVEKRASQGLTFLGGYRWAKCMDEISASDLSHDDFTSIYPRHDYGRCAYDVTNQFQGSYIYQFPQVKKYGLLGRELIGGWATNGILTFRSGQPINITSGEDLSASGIGADRADIAGNPSLAGGRTKAQQIAEWFNTGAFKLNAPGTYGNVGRMFLTGPGYTDVDFSLLKSFPIPKIGERSRIDFRADFFNGFNWTNFSNPGGNLSSSSTYGKITAANSPRIIQFALKLYF
jgi:hypothetical protein